MCGIAGIVRYDAPARAISVAPIHAMRRALRHRGPDGEGTWFGRSAALAHTRLALLDREGGAQPMLRRGRWAMVYNGEVYNHAELRRELSGSWDFETRSDVEVVLAAWATWGRACLPRLNGMFAFFVWDEELEVGYGARDLLGVKPFVYRQTATGIELASEAKAILAAQHSAPRAHVPSVIEYLVAPSMSGVEHAMFEDLEHLPAGSLLRVDRRGVVVERWGDYGLLERSGEVSPELVREKLAAAVRRCLVADVPVGAYLSGGVDSTAIAALAERPLCFTVTFEEQSAYDYGRSTIVTSDDTPFARMAAKELALELVEVPVAREGIAEDLRAISAADDALPAWEQEIAQHHLARAASARRKAVLVGDAADETHYGYHFLLDEVATRAPEEILKRFGAAPVLEEHDFGRRYARLAEEAGHAWTTPLERTLATTYLIVKRWLARLLHNGDIHAMAFGLEARVPFADIELLDVARRVDPRVAFAGGVEKSLLRRAVAGLVPGAVRARKKSALPKDQRVARIYQAEARRLIPERRAFLGRFLDLDAVLALADERRELAEAERAILFRTICLAHWAEAYGARV